MIFIGITNGRRKTKDILILNHDRKENYANLLPIQISTLAFQFRAESGYPFSSLVYKNKSNINSLTVTSICLYHTYIIPNNFYISRYRQKHFISVSILFLFFILQLFKPKPNFVLVQIPCFDFPLSKTETWKINVC